MTSINRTLVVQPSFCLYCLWSQPVFGFCLTCLLRFWAVCSLADCLPVADCVFYLTWPASLICHSYGLLVEVMVWIEGGVVQFCELLTHRKCFLLSFLYITTHFQVISRAAVILLVARLKGHWQTRSKLKQTELWQKWRGVKFRQHAASFIAFTLSIRKQWLTRVQSDSGTDHVQKALETCRCCS